MRIDAHQHYWQLARGDYGWLTPEAGLLYKDYLPSQLAPLLQQQGITKSIVVQAAPTIEETEFLLELCHQEASLAGVVGWLDLESEQFEKQLRGLMLHPYFLGLRPNLKIGGPKGLTVNQKVMQSLMLMAKLNVPLDLLIVPEHLAEMIEVLEQIPHL
ncbi:hypothetical protein EHS13_09085 [Paenibacillus psychroresistens]|uniref:Amidohydrolase-related domain-containing protein n=1 Tax=Paenibacillus psychroresistens TaxID=1778678 RepID=A0A6B8RI50_9BACL|nr:amidohydrolase family protein [Paenibacillus psychroresistens]QGQ95028.1 hypothetical protein EHS13_09085 [Paenibacillus psychroresistens]